jgi:hypothetical protein
MAYAGPTSPSSSAPDRPVPPGDVPGRGRSRASAAPPSGVLPSRVVPMGRPYTTDSSPALLVGLGVAIGVLVGASAAMLLTPVAGGEMRGLIARRGRRVGRRAGYAWEDLQEEFSRARHLARRALQRRRQRGAGALEEDD